MSSRSLSLDPQLQAYLREHGVREPREAAALRAATAERSDAVMQISPEQGAFLSLFLRAMGASRVIEVGTFTGYSALWMARALPEDGLLVACDVNAETTAIGARAWREAGVDTRVDLRIAPAADTLQSLRDEGHEGSFDLVFIDADKPGYATYVEHAHALLRAGGVVAIDNVLWSGSVLDDSDTRESTAALRALNTALKDDLRWDLSMVPIGDGLTLLRKR